MSDIEVGVIGTGFAASSHIDALQRLPRVHVAAIAGSSQDKADAAARRFNLGAGFGDYRSLLDDDSIEVVHNCTPNDLHAEINAAVIDAGKHLLSEKPLALDSRQTAALTRAASSSPLVTAVCFNYRHYPLVRQAKSMLASGTYGRTHFVHGGYLQDWLLHEDDWNWRLDSVRAGASRAVADIGSHWIDLVQYVTGERVQSVFADLTTLHPERARPAGEVETFARSGSDTSERVRIHTEDFGTIALRFASGARGALNVSQVSPGRKNHLHWEIDTSHAAFGWDQEEPNRLWIGRRDEANTELVRDPSLLVPEAAALTHFPGGHQEGWPDGLRNLFIDTYSAIEARARGRTYEPSFATFADAHQVTLTVEAIVASSRSGTWIDVTANREVGA
ncbi:MAG: Gfo/Idh/MocA family protein [Actinomycetota bacterium]